MKRLLVIGTVLFMLMPFSALAQDFCEGNFDCDQDVDGTDAFVFKSDFGRSSFSDPCPNSSDCCSGSLSPLGRWCDQGNGTVKDMSTGLVWLKKADWGGQYTFWVNTMNGVNAQDRAAQLWDGSPSEGTAGLSDLSVEGDWRLPTKTELVGITVGDEYIRSSQMYFFTGVQSYYYWSGTSYAGDPSYAWYVDMFGGLVGNDGSTGYNFFFVWPVRGPIKCGNNKLDAGEECDGDLFPPDKDTCAEAGYPYGGVLTCNNNCKITTQDCYECSTCSDCNNQPCIGGHCGACVVNEDCCAPLGVCFVGLCM